MNSTTTQQLHQRVERLTKTLEAVLTEIQMLKRQVKGEDTPQLKRQPAEISDDMLKAATEKAELIVNTAIREMWEHIHMCDTENTAEISELKRQIREFEKDVTSKIREVTLIDREAMTKAALTKALNQDDSAETTK